MIPRHRVQKSTIVRVRNLGLRAFFRSAELLAPRFAGRRARDLWFTVPPTHGRLPRYPGRRAVHGHRARVRRSAATSSARGPTVYLVHGWGGRGSQLGRARRAAGRDRATGSSCSTHPPTATPTPDRRDRAAPTASSSAKALDAVFAGSDRPRPSSRTRSAPSRPTWRCASAGSAPRGSCSLAPMVEVGEPLRPVPGRTRASASGPAAPSTARSTTSSGSRWPSSTRSTRPRTSSPCRPWSCTTAATGRRRTPTRSDWSTDSPDARLVTTEGLGHRRILRDPAVIAHVVDFVGGRTTRGGRLSGQGPGQAVRWWT